MSEVLGGFPPIFWGGGLDPALGLYCCFLNSPDIPWPRWGYQKVFPLIEEGTTFGRQNAWAFCDTGSPSCPPKKMRTMAWAHFRRGIFFFGMRFCFVHWMAHHLLLCQGFSKFFEENHPETWVSRSKYIFRPHVD